MIKLIMLLVFFTACDSSFTPNGSHNFATGDRTQGQNAEANSPADEQITMDPGSDSYDDYASLKNIFGDGEPNPQQPLDDDKAKDLFGGSGGEGIEFEPKIIKFTEGCVHRNNSYDNKKSHSHTLKKCSVNLDLSEHFDFSSHPNAEVVVNFNMWGYPGINKQLSPGLYQTPPPNGSCSYGFRDWVSGATNEYPDGIRFVAEKAYEVQIKRSGTTGIIRGVAPEATPHPGSKWLYSGVKYDNATRKLNITNAGNGWGKCSYKSGDGCAACLSDIVVVIGPQKKSE